jgi:hypothetical protein
MIPERGYGRTVARLLTVFALAALALLVQACGQEEDDRPLVFQKGTYLGQPDEKLDQDQIEALRQRAAQQRM